MRDEPILPALADSEGIFEPLGLQTEVRSVDLGDWREACRSTVDWVEIVKPS